MSNSWGRLVFAGPTADLRAIRVEIKRHKSRCSTMDPLTSFHPHPQAVEDSVARSLGSEAE
jgi:hypothetical protein